MAAQVFPIAKLTVSTTVKSNWPSKQEHKARDQPFSARRPQLVEHTRAERIMEIVQLHCILKDVTLYPQMRSIFNARVEGLTASFSGGNRTLIELFGGSRKSGGQLDPPE
jgi:hypothetical protein